MSVMQNEFKDAYQNYDNSIKYDNFSMLNSIKKENDEFGDLTTEHIKIDKFENSEKTFEGVDIKNNQELAFNNNINSTNNMKGFDEIDNTKVISLPYSKKIKIINESVLFHRMSTETKTLSVEIYLSLFSLVIFFIKNLKTNLKIKISLARNNLI